MRALLHGYSIPRALPSMPFSEAIRLGSSLRPQAFSSLLAEGKSCAVGAALEALGFKRYTSNALFWVLIERYPFLNQTRGCPICKLPDGSVFIISGRGTVLDMVMHLNDTHRWTREEIADWVQAIEREPLSQLMSVEV